MTDPRVELVARGYDAIAEEFAEWRDRIVGDPRLEWAEALAARLDDGSRVLELGCGAGTAETQQLARRFRVTGVDVSTEQIARARASVPEAEFLLGDFTSLELARGSFEAVVSFYALNHVPRELLPGLFADVRRWLVPGGLFLAALGASDNPGWEGESLGTETYFSGYPPNVNRALLAEEGFELERDEVVTFREPDGDVTFHWILARSGR